MPEKSIFLIDASRLFGEGLRRIFSASSFTAVHGALSVGEALPLIGSLQPSIVLVDLPDSGEAAIEGISQIRVAAPRARIVVLTDNVWVNRIADALSAGVDGYLIKNMSADALHESLHLVLLGEKVFPTGLAQLLTNGWMMSGSGMQIGHSNGLTNREMQILGCLLHGATNKQIAIDLTISDGTVKVHLKSILKKTGAQNRTQAAIWARENGIAAPALMLGEFARLESEAFP